MDLPAFVFESEAPPAVGLPAFLFESESPPWVGLPGFLFTDVGEVFLTPATAIVGEDGITPDVLVREREFGAMWLIVDKWDPDRIVSPAQDVRVISVEAEPVKAAPRERLPADIREQDRSFLVGGDD